MMENGDCGDAHVVFVCNGATPSDLTKLEGARDFHSSLSLEILVRILRVSGKRPAEKLPHLRPVLILSNAKQTP